MTSLARIRPSLRRAAFVAALGALMVPATAGAAVHAEASAKKKKAKPPVSPASRRCRSRSGRSSRSAAAPSVAGATRTRSSSSAPAARPIFVKADVGTDQAAAADRARRSSRLRWPRATALPCRPASACACSPRSSASGFTKASRSPIVGPELPPTPGDAAARSRRRRLRRRRRQERRRDRRRRRSPRRRHELRYKTDGCKADSDGDGVTDGYEIQSARDLNDDEYQFAQSVLPYPEKRPYPNALFADSERRLRRRLADPRRGVLALAGLPRPRRPRPADLLGRQPVLALRPRRRRPPAGLAAPRPVRQAGDFLDWAGGARLPRR